jgi:bifunctional DNA-binding transcriptional regulator/antitoxin component of YhaV-PrlF toxin-antitoxin module
MPTLKLHYDGWLSLPAALRRNLGLNSGDRLEAELIDGAIVLRPAVRGRQPRGPEVGAIPPPTGGDAGAPGILPLTEEAAPARRKPGRPRKVAVAGEPATASTPKRPRGRPRKALITPEFEPAALPEKALEPWKLRKKADLQPAAPSPDEAPPRDRQPAAIRQNPGHQPVERRPFRNVEVRPLARERRHPNPRIQSSQEPES